MRPNKYREREKYYRKLEKEMVQARQKMLKPQYEPLEKPYAMGWNVYLDIHPNIKLDAHRVGILKEIVALLNLKRVYFTRKVDVIKFFRKSKYKFSEILQYAFEEKIFTHYFDKWDYWRWKSISFKMYEKLPEHLKKYFILYDSYRGWRRFEKRARVNFSAFNYSHNENDYVVVKIKQAYATKRAVPDGEAESIYERAWLTLKHSGYWGSYYHWKEGQPKERKKWKSTLKTVTRLGDYQDYNWDIATSGAAEWIPIKDSFSDLEEELLVKNKIFKHKH